MCRVFLWPESKEHICGPLGKHGRCLPEPEPTARARECYLEKLSGEFSLGRIMCSQLNSAQTRNMRIWNRQCFCPCPYRGIWPDQNFSFLMKNPAFFYLVCYDPNAPSQIRMKSGPHEKNKQIQSRKTYRNFMRQNDRIWMWNKSAVSGAKEMNDNSRHTPRKNYQKT